jgi:hypothetical protein
MVGDLVDVADAVHLCQDASRSVRGHNCLGLLVVEVQPVADDGLVVVAAAGLLRTAQEPGNQFLVVRGQLEDDVELLVPLARISSR